MGSTTPINEGRHAAADAISSAPATITHRPRRKVPRTFQRPMHAFAIRAVTIITSATVAKARLNDSGEYCMRPTSNRGATEKNTKNVPMPALKPSV